ncbi:MAG: hypothetical protein DRH49_00760 [Candidatus Coatesbacteria bacterium]|nr:MAG: hypothetical protein DRH49_00760 [Candidatus Coatesbacteria bacterium]
MGRKAYITEIFNSIEGEGLKVGTLSLFIRFAGCNLRCPPCDTQYAWEDEPEMCTIYLRKGEKKIKNPIDISTLIDIIFDYKSVERLVFTGGEPLLNAGYIEKLAEQLQYDRDICVETNSTIPQGLARVITSISEVSCDIKLKSVWGLEQDTQRLKRFLKIAKKRLVWVKCVVKPDTPPKEIEGVSQVVASVSPIIPLILHPMDNSGDFNLDTIATMIRGGLKHLKEVRFLPRIHRTLGLR